MNIVFLSSRSAHHYYLINEINRSHPVKMVFFQTRHTQPRGTWASRFKRWRKVENIRASFKGVLSRILFGREGKLEEKYEKEKFFNGSEPFLESGISSKEVFSFNSPDIVEEVKRQDPDLIIVFGTDILKGEILNAAKLATLNIHRGILPKYRGGGVLTWALYYKDFENLGATVHVCTEALDGGDIVGQKFYRLEKGDKMHTLRYKTTNIALDVLRDVLDGYKKGTVEYKKQQPEKLWISRDLTVAKMIIARKNLAKYVKMKISQAVA